jgi:SOS response regulatory protein OraA/RecX
VAALAILAQRRLTEAQLWKKLEARGYEHEEIAEAVASCKANGYIDDRLYASLYVEGARKAVGDARLCADLVKRGIDREAALTILADAEVGEEGRIEAAYLKIRRIGPQLAYPSIARKLERLGFPSSLIYRTLRKHAADELGDLVREPDGACPEPAEGSRFAGG